MVTYINETDFVIENKKLVYPEIVTDGLQLYYDAKGKRDTDYHRDTMLDMSGNKNHGKLYNFAYEKHSGYKDGLVFDYIDDKLVRPALDLKPDDFTFMLNGNIISFSPDGTVKRVQDGEVIESKGFNLVRNGDFVDEVTGWGAVLGKLQAGSDTALFTPTKTASRITKNIEMVVSHVYYHAMCAKATGTTPMIYTTAPVRSSKQIKDNGEWDVVSVIHEPTVSNTEIRYVYNGTVGIPIEVDWILMIDLTQTFGAGNEPTKEQMDEIINRFGFIPNAQDLIDRVEYKGNDLGDMENIIDGLYKTEVLSSEEIYTDKADDDAVVHVEVDGKSYQHAGSGKNMFNKYLLSDRSKFELSTYSASPVIQLKPNTIYVLSASRVNPSPDGNQLVLNVMDATDGTPLFGSSDYNTKRIRSLFNLLASHEGIDNFRNTFTTPTSGLISFSYYDNRSGKSSEGNWFTDVMIDAQLEEGSTATAYEPPAPTPDYPIEIHSLNDFDVVSSVGKENLLPASNNYLLAHNNNGGIDKNSFDSATGIGKLTLGAGRALSTYNSTGYNRSSLVNGKIYTFSIDVKSDIDRSIYIDWRRGSSAQQIKANEWVRISYSREYNSSDTNYLWGLSSSTLSNQETNVYYKNPKVEEGVTKNTKWTPHLKSVAYDISNSTTHKINLLLSEPLRSVGDIKDRLFRDNDGVWKIERRVGETIVGPTVNFAMGAPTGGWKVDGNTIPFYGFGEPSSNNQPSLTNKFKTSVGSWIVGSDLEGFSSGYRNFYIFRINKDRLDTVDSAGFKKWLEVNPVKVLYVLNTSITETLSQPLQDKLNNIRSFEDSNYVYIVGGSTNLLDTVPLLNNHWYPSSGTLQNPVTQNGHTSTQEQLPVYPGAKIHLTKETTVDNYWRIVWVDKDNNVVIREVSTVNDLVLTAPNGAYGMRVSYPNGSNPVIKFDKSGITQTVAENLKPTLHAKFLYNNWYKEDRVINNLMIYNRALTNEEMLQNYKTIKRRWGM